MLRAVIQRYFWVAGAATVAVCAFYAARIAGHVLEAEALADATEPARVAQVAPPVSAATTAGRSKEGVPLVARSMFCAECVPVAVADVGADPSGIPLTRLPLALVATNVGTRAEYSFATVVGTAVGSEHQGSFRVGDALPGAGPVASITFRHVDFYADAARTRLERLSLLSPGEGAEAPPPATITPSSGDESVSDMAARGVHKISDTNFEVDRWLVDQALSNPMAFAKGARVWPAQDKTTGKTTFKVHAIRPGSPLAKIGLTNGDALSSVNGMELTDANKALEVYTKVRESNSLQIEITRRGKPMTLHYTIK